MKRSFEEPLIRRGCLKKPLLWQGEDWSNLWVGGWFIRRWKLPTATLTANWSTRHAPYRPILAYIYRGERGKEVHLKLKVSKPSAGTFRCLLKAHASSFSLLTMTWHWTTVCLCRMLLPSSLKSVSSRRENTLAESSLTGKFKDLFRIVHCDEIVKSKRL